LKRDPARSAPAAAPEPWTLRIEALWRQPDWRWHLLLRPLEAVYSTLVTLRRALYRHGLRASRRLAVPVLVVGNRVAGGAGKTPTTIALVQGLQQRGWRPGIVSRGFGGQGRQARPVELDSQATDVGDEPLLMARRTCVPVWVGRDRASAGAALCQAHPDVNVLVCDDGLQHLSLARDAELVVFDERGAGNGHLLPAGPLREPIGAPSLARRQWTLYNASAPSTRLPGVCTRRELVGLVSLDDWWRGQPADPALVEQVRALGAITASAGIGQPQRFFDALQALGLVIQPWPLADHARLDPLPWPDSVQALVVTEKDAIKLDAQRLRTERPALRVWVAPLVFTLPDGLLDEISAELSVAVAPR